MTHAQLNICIVGAGPRGLSVLERICANARTLSGATAVTVYVVDPYQPGPGQVWRVEQNRHLLMNTIASQITVFPDETVDMAGPLTTGPSLHEWATTLLERAAAGQEQHASWVLAEAARLGPDSYPSRAFYGYYLSWVFTRLLATAPPHLRVVVHSTRGIALDDDASADLQRLVCEDGTTIEELDAVVLAQGHVALEMTPAERALTDFAAEHRLRYLPPGNPADMDLSLIRGEDTVLLRGLGLCFFDYLALLTEGRGGTYHRVEGKLVYRPTGREPRLLATSRRGLPYHARGENEKGPHGRHVPAVLTPDLIDRLRLRSAQEGGLRLRTDIWPLIAKEVETVYYTGWLTERGEPADEVERFRAEYLGCAYSSPDERELIERAGIRPDQWWNWQQLQRPYLDQAFTSTAGFSAWLLDYLRRDLAEARRGNVTSPLKAAVDVLRDLRNEVRLLVDHGGLDGRSHSEDLDGWYTPLNAFLSIGPPASRIEETIALIEAGVLQILGPGVHARPDPDNHSFRIETRYSGEPAIHADTLIEARLHLPDVRSTADPLMRYLLARGRAIPFRIACREGKQHETGGLAVIDRPYYIVDATGRVHPRRFALGVPTEAVHWATAAGIRPGVNSVTLADADAIARTILWLPEGTGRHDPATTRTDSAELMRAVQ